MLILDFKGLLNRRGQTTTDTEHSNDIAKISSQTRTLNFSFDLTVSS